MRSIIIGALLAPCRGLLVDPLCAVRSSRHSERAGLLAASSGGIRGGFLRRQWASYEAALERRPMRTQMATAAVLAGVGDVIAQYLEGASAFAPRRFVALVAVNVLYIVPLLSFFYGANEKLVGRPMARRGELARTTAMLAVDQLLNAPLCIFGFFYAFNLASFATGRSGCCHSCSISPWCRRR